MLCLGVGLHRPEQDREGQRVGCEGNIQNDHFCAESFLIFKHRAVFNFIYF